MRIRDMYHPEYMYWIDKWSKYRSVATGGYDFILKYLVKFSAKESDQSFQLRRNMSYCPAHAKSAIIEIKNAIYQRMHDITRLGGSLSYQEAIQDGVDAKGRTMNGFIGCEVLFELLAMGKIGVYVDRESIGNNPTRVEAAQTKPYLYTYRAEKILNWSFDKYGNLISLLLEDSDFEFDELTGLPTDTNERYRHLRLTPNGVLAQVITPMADGKDDVQETILRIKRIPFVIFELNQSLLVDVADYQIALLNIASSDVNFCVKANFPFLTEQYNPMSEFVNIRSQMPLDANNENPKAERAANNTADVGVEQGRKYPVNTDRPEFIHPSPEPLLASMKKQEDMKREVRQLVNLALTAIEPRRESADSKREDRASKEEGLSYIGLELEHGEQEIARIWSEYEATDNVATIKYPINYSLRTDTDRRQEAKELSDLLPKVPSMTYQKEVTKKIASVTVGHSVSNETLEKIHKEIDKATVIVTDPEVIKMDLEAGLVGVDTASKARGYPEGETEKAKKDHAERAERIALAQSKAAARGVADLDSTNQPENEKKMNKMEKTNDPNGSGA